MNDEFVIISDFDGTITKKDVGYNLVRKFKKDKSWLDPFNKWKNGKTGSEEYTRAMYSGLEIPMDILYYELESIEIDPGIDSFVNYIRNNDIIMEIVSDGFDFYIDPILRLNGLEDIPFYSNHLEYYNNFHMKTEYPYRHSTCPWCGNCKVQHVRRHLSAGKRVVYIGDSYSDIYAAKISDVVFAKKRLEEILSGMNESFIVYETFNDILDVIKTGKFIYRYNDLSFRKCFREI